MRGLMTGVLLGALFASQAVAFEKEEVTLETSDGVKIAGYFVKGSRDAGPAAVLLHMLGRSKEDWDPILDKYLLPNTSASYLAIDLRGHGASMEKNGKPLALRTFRESDYADMVKDVEAAVNFLRLREDVDGKSIGIIGASIGANVAINYAAGDREIKAVALLSGSLDYKGVKTAKALRSYANRPIYLAAAREDNPAGLHLPTMVRNVLGVKVVKGLEGNLHGTRMFGRTRLHVSLVAFLNDHLK